MAYWSFRLSCMALICMCLVSSYQRLPPEWLAAASPFGTAKSLISPLDSTATLTLTAPATITAGTPVTVQLSYLASPIEDDNVAIPATSRLFLMHTNGTSLVETPLQNGQATFRLDDTITRVAGTLEMQATIGQQTASATMSIVPLAPVEPLLALVGPRSITADGDHWSMLTVLPQDHFGNAVADGTVVTVRASYPATAVTSGTSPQTDEISQVQTEHLLAAARIHGRTKAGRIYIAATAGNAHSPERSVMAVPGPPVRFGLQLEPVQLTADGRRLITVNTDPIVDANGNPLLDGTSITFIITTSAGSERRVPAQVIEGKATVQLQAPAQPERWTIRALLFDTVSDPLTLTFDAGIGLTSIAIRIQSAEDRYILVAGPILGTLDQYIPDGSEVTFVIRHEAHNAVIYQTTAQAQAGFATADVRATLLPPATYTITVSAGVGRGELRVALPSEP